MHHRMAASALASTLLPTAARSGIRRRSHLFRSCYYAASKPAPSLALGSTSSRPGPCTASCPRRFATAASKSDGNHDAPAPKGHSNAADSGSNGSIGSNINDGQLSSNANPTEVNKFSSFASNWWDARSNPLVGMNPIRVKFMRNIVGQYQPASSLEGSPSDVSSSSLHLPLHNKRILDIGCGGGLLTESLSRLGASLVVGLDASSAVVEVAKMHSFHDNSRLLASEQKLGGNQSSDIQNNSNIRYIGGVTVEELASHWLAEREKEKTISSPPSKACDNHELFDIITALEVIEHVPNPTSLLNAATSLLKPNGILFVSTINRTMKSYGLAIVAAEYITGKVPVGTHDWNQFWSPTEVDRMVCSHSSSGAETMKQIAMSGMVIEPPFVNMQWSLEEKDLDVNWIGAYQKGLSA